MKKTAAKLSRRKLLQAGAGLALTGALPEAAAAQGAAPRPDVYQSLGVRHVINATGTVTNLGGSVMPPEVVAAWADASRHFVNLLELHDKVVGMASARYSKSRRTGRSLSKQGRSSARSKPS